MTPTRDVFLSALVAELPEERVADAALAKRLGLSEPVVAEFGRGRLRAYSPDGEGPADLSQRAAERALESAGRTAADVDFIVFATNTPDLYFPGSGCLLQSSLGCSTVGAMDLRAQCAGFVASLDVARRFVTTGAYDSVLVAAADTPSHYNRYDGESPELACMMSDGGAVALVEAEASGGFKVLSAVHGADGSRSQDYWCEYPSSRAYTTAALPDRARLTVEAAAAGRHFPLFDYQALEETAERVAAPCFRDALAEAGVDSVDVTIVAHLHPDIEREIGASLGAAAGRVVTPGMLYSGGSALPTALAAFSEEGGLDGASTVALVTVGSGASWGAAVLEVVR